MINIDYKRPSDKKNLDYKAKTKNLFNQLCRLDSARPEGIAMIPQLADVIRDGNEGRYNLVNFNEDRPRPQGIRMVTPPKPLP